MQTFSLDDARTKLREYFGYPDFRAPQIPAVEAVLSRRDALIVLPTGGGKSVCFQVPALLFPGLTIVVSPLISLMVDQVQAIQARGIAAEFINSTLSPDEAARRLTRLRRGELKLLYVAPERLALGIGTAHQVYRRVALLAIDEAHCVSEHGHDFRPSYLQLRDVRRALGDPQTVALTATATPEVRRDIRRLLGLRGAIEIVGGFDRPNLRFSVERIATSRAREARLADLIAERPGAAVVYASTRRLVDRTCRALIRRRVRCVGYHAGLSPERRAGAQDAFMSGGASVIVATNAFGMGIDKKDVRQVLHCTVSGSLEDYYQEAGRAGRDGAPSRCVLLYDRADRFVHDRFRDAAYPAPDAVRRVLAAIRRVAERAPRVVLDPVTIAAPIRPRLSPEIVSRSLHFLQRRGILTVCPVEGVRVRVLATPLRLACEEAALTDAAHRVLRVTARMDTWSWTTLSHRELDLREMDLQRALAELEARQLVCVERTPPVATLSYDERSEFAFATALEALAHRRNGERSKLNAMMDYATTRRCRRAHILRYFGEVNHSEYCARCDNCVND